MTDQRTNPASMPRRRNGYSLMELVVSMASATLILGGLSASLYIASGGLDHRGMARRTEADQVLDRFIGDVEYALTFSERTANAVTFTVPDRDGNGLSETIRYAWSGTPGDPLTYEYNGSAAETIADDVHHFDLAAATRFMKAPVIPPAEGGSKLLLVVTDPASPTAQETATQSLIESWGYTVTLIDDNDSQANFDAAVAENDVAYVPQAITSSSLGTKLREAPIGVVIEEEKITDEFGICSGEMTFTEASIEVTDNTHYITEPFNLGAVTFAATAQAVGGRAGTPAPGLTILALKPSSATSMLDVIETGGELFDSGTAAGRRVKLPWGGNEFDINSLTADGRSIMQRAIAWAAGASGIDAGPLLFVVSDAANPSVQETARQTLMESWGYTVTLIDDDATTLEFGEAMGLNEVAYVSLEITTLTTVANLSDATLGLVNEHRELYGEFGFAGGPGNSQSGTQIEIFDNSHSVTSPFNIGLLTICDSTQSLLQTTGNVDAMTVLAQLPNGSGATPATLGTFEVGQTLNGGGTAAGRRVMVPWGDAGFDFTTLNADGLTIMRRAIDWAAASSGGGGPAPDSNFGYETQFGNLQSNVRNIQVGTQVTLPEDGTITSITAYVNAAGKKTRYAVYTDNGGEPGSLIVETDIMVFGGTSDWHTASVAPTPLTAGTYWLALSHENALAEYYYEGTGGQTRYVSKDAAKNGFLSNWGSSTATYPRQVSIYGTYTPGN